MEACIYKVASFNQYFSGIGCSAISEVTSQWPNFTFLSVPVHFRRIKYI